MRLYGFILATFLTTPVLWGQNGSTMQVDGAQPGIRIISPLANGEWHHPFWRLCKHEVQPAGADQYRKCKEPSYCEPDFNGNSSWA